MRTELCEIMTKYGSDKGFGVHNYTILYNELFFNIRNNQLNIFELGLGTNNTDVPSNMGASGVPGASLRGWREYFPNSNVYGADIDKRILFNENRIQCFYCDQTNPKIVTDMWNNPQLKDLLFDIIIEDGLHEFSSNLIFLENSLHKLKLGGIYICEDLKLETVKSFESILDSLKIKYLNYSFEIKILDNPNNFYNDNNLLIIKKTKNG